MTNTKFGYLFAIVLLLVLAAFGGGAIYIGNFDLVNTIAIALIAALTAAVAYFFKGGVDNKDKE